MHRRVAFAFLAVTPIFQPSSAFGLPVGDDWLVPKAPAEPSFVEVSADGSRLTLTNGLITRSWWVQKPTREEARGFAVCTEFRSHEKKSNLIRALDHEAVITLDGVRYNVGGANLDSIGRAYLNQTEVKQLLSLDGDAFGFYDFQFGPIKARYSYRPRRFAPKDVPWPPKGIHLEMKFKASADAPKPLRGLSVSVHYEVYDGAPLAAKWVQIAARDAARKQRVKAAVNAVESLSVNLPWASESVGGYGWLWLQTDEPHGNQVSWFEEPNGVFGSFMPKVNCSYEGDFFIEIGHKTEPFVSFRVLEMLVGSADRERVGLARRKMLRMLAPQTSENPIYFHFTHTDSKQFRNLVDELSSVGFEMVLYSFGSGFNLESKDPGFLPKLKADIAYANSKGIEVGGYDLISWTRRLGPEWATRDQHGQNSGNACFASGWFDHLLDTVLNVISYTNLSVLETDGPYGGYPCHAANHSHHIGAADSVYQQNKLQGKFFAKLRELEVYINQPDTYFYHGGSKTGMGYNEGQYSLPRWLDLSVSRQGMFDDTFHYTPTVGWMFLPIEVYHGGGENASFEPLSQNIKAFGWGLAQYFGSGVAACYRGSRIFDSPETKAVVSKWVQFYKRHRSILTSDVVHVRRPDLQSVDAVLHVNPSAKDGVRGLAMVFNPTDASFADKALTLPAYYTGLTDAVAVAVAVTDPGDSNDIHFRETHGRLDRAFNLQVQIPDLGPRHIAIILLREPSFATDVDVSLITV